MIFVDLSHNERIQTFPDRIFQNTNMDMLVSFNSPTDDLTDFPLEEHNLVVLGHPRPVNETESLFTRQEVKNITSYVARGGNLLLTSGARGDYNFEPSFGSLRAFSHLTGITQFHYAMLFHQQAHKYLTKRWNLVIDVFPDHPIFQEMTPQDSIVLGKSTYFTVRPSHTPTVLLSDPNTQSHNYATKTKQRVGAVPILTAVEYGQGRVVTVASSSFLTRDPSNGVTVESNTKLLQGICRWLLSEEGS
jgi:hypothetical protein